MAFNANARSASTSSGRESADRFTRQAQHITGDLREPNWRLIHFTAGYCTASGAVTRRARTRIQSSPSISAANCAADSRITPSSTRGQRNLLPSSLLANRHRPVPSQKISFTLSARFARKQKITPEKRVGLQLLFRQRRKPVHPFAEVHRLRRHQDPERTRRNQHPAAHAPARRT